MPKKKLQNFRNQIDKIDRKILNLLNLRVSKSIKIGKIKKKLNESLLTRKREIEIFNNLKKENVGPFKDINLINIYKKILSESRKLVKSKIKND